MFYYELESSETWQTWPPEDNLVEFLQSGGRGRLITQLTVTTLINEVSLQATVMSTDIDNAHKALTDSMDQDSMDQFQSELLGYNSSTEISDTFVL